MNDIIFNIANIFVEVEKHHNLMNFKKFREDKIENKILNYMIELLSSGIVYISFKTLTKLYITEMKFKEKLTLEQSNNIIFIENCIDLLYSYDKEELISLAMCICEGHNKSLILNMLGDNY